MNSTSMGVYKDHDIEKKIWVGGTGDERNHAATDGQIIPINKAFQMADGSSLMYPGDPAGGVGSTVNCRCCVAAYVE